MKLWQKRKKLKKIYLEITNNCNLACAFCAPTSRKKKYMSVEDFFHILEKIEGRAEILYLHVMGEPFLHPQIDVCVNEAVKKGFKVHITSNGSLLSQVQDTLVDTGLKRLNLSLQSLEQFPEKRRAEKTIEILEAVDFLLEKNKNLFVSLRLWTQDKKTFTQEITSYLENYFSLPHLEIEKRLLEKNSFLIHPRLAIHAADSFDWPDTSQPFVGERGFCMGLRDQAAILCDGSLVPCCLDRNGAIKLGNLLEEDWDEIMQSKRASTFYEAFSERRVVETICKHCSYRLRFDKEIGKNI